MCHHRCLRGQRPAGLIDQRYTSAYVFATTVDADEHGVMILNGSVGTPAEKIVSSSELAGRALRSVVGTFNLERRGPFVRES